MAAVATSKKTTECDEIAMKQFRESLKSVIKEIRIFNSIFSSFLEEQRKQARELYTLVTRYNILNS
jgi:uncharacterized membrane-anchored protein